MRGPIRSRFLRHALPLLVLAGVLLQGCGLFLPSTLAIPQNFTASTNLEDRIELSWTEVRGATAYHVYRSADPSDPVWEEGAYGPIPYAVTTANAFSDDTGAAATFYYQVTAVQQYTGAESSATPVVEGRSISGPAAWQPPAIVGLTAVSTLRLAVDDTTGAAYVLSVPNESPAAVTVNRIEPDGTLTQLGPSFGTVDGTVARSADLIAFEGQIRVVVAEAGTGTLQAYSYVSVMHTFVTSGSPLGTARTAGPPLVTLTTRGSGDHWLFFQTASTIEAVNFNDLGSSVGSQQIATGLDAPALATAMEADAGHGSVAIVYETEDGSGSTTSVLLRTQTTGDFDTEVDISTGSPAVTALDVAVDPGNGSVWTVASDDTDIYLDDGTGTLNEPLSTALGGSPAISATAVSIAARAGSILLLYGDTVANAQIQESNDTGVSWTQLGPAGLSFVADIAPADLEAGADTIHAALTNGGFGLVRTFQ
jgi:hypothetical protein